MNEAQLIAAIDASEPLSHAPTVEVNPDQEMRDCAKAIVECQDGSKIQEFRLTTEERGKVLDLLWSLGEKKLHQEALGLA